MNRTSRNSIATGILNTIETAGPSRAERQTAVVEAARELLIESWLRRRAGVLKEISPAFRRLVARLAELEEAEGA